MHRHLVFLQIHKQVSDEGQGLFLHQAVHVFLTDFDACNVDALHITFIGLNLSVNYGDKAAEVILFGKCMIFSDP